MFCCGEISILQRMMMIATPQPPPTTKTGSTPTKIYKKGVNLESGKCLAGLWPKLNAKAGFIPPHPPPQTNT